MSRINKIFGIGWAKTGTTSLGACFRKLGYNHQGQHLGLLPAMIRGDLDGLFKVARLKDTFEDWPWILAFKELDAEFPGSLFVLTTREPDCWISSYRAMLEREGTSSEELWRIRRYIYGTDVATATDEQLLQRYADHNEQVLNYFSERPQDLLVVDWEKGDGWTELCSFLKVDPPDLPFPHLNRRSC
jgi:hypothetical protein